MSDKVELDTFPRNTHEALAMLYVQKQDLSNVTPEQLHTMYYQALYALRREYSRKQNSGWFKAESEGD